MQHRQTHAEERRPGFTVLELLMVVGIIGLLVTLVVVASGHLITGAKERATRATVAKVHGLLEERRRAIDIAAQGKGFEQDIRFLTQRIASYNTSPLYKAAIARALPALVIKSKMRALFPQLPASSPADSSELLLEALTQKEVFGVVPVGDDYFGSSEKKDTDGDGKLEIVDAWGRPLRFYLWPTRLVRPGGLDDGGDGFIQDSELAARIDTNLVNILMPSVAANSADLSNLKKDPDDPLGALVLLGNAQASGYQKAESWPTGTVPAPASLPDFLRFTHTLSTYHVPLIVSAGPDEDLGLYEPYDTANFGHLAQPSLTSPGALYDNITNYQSAGGN